jgi:uncharacterized membrane protein HdeD (DUF308 family)
MLRALCNKWWCVLLRGLTAIVAGAIAIAHPDVTLLVLAILVGCSALVDGLGCVLVGLAGGAGGRPWWEMIVLGLLGVGFGIAALAWPGLLLATLVALAGAWAVARGVIEIVAAVKLRRILEDEWILGLSGALSIAFGVLLLAKPLSTLHVIGIVIGCFLFVYGLAATVFSLRLRALRNRLPAA